MEKEKHYKKDRHKNSSGCGVRLDNYLMERLNQQAEKEGRSKNSIIVSALEEYLYKNEDWKVIIASIAEYQLQYS